MTTSKSAATDTDAAAAIHPHRWLALAVLALGLALIVLDGTIVGVSLPTIIRELNLDLAGAQWVTSLYSVVFAALLLTAGRLGDRYGRRSLFLCGLVIFTAGSISAALSGGAGSLIIARVIQGFGGAAILPATLSSVNAIFRGKDRAAAFGVWGAVMAGAAAVGPLAGGVLTEYAGWRWIFWVNVPLGVVLCLAALAVVPNTSARAANGNGNGTEPAAKSDDAASKSQVADSAQGADVLGFILSAVGFGALVFGVIEGPKIGIWQQVETLSLGVTDWPASWPSAAGIALLLAAIVLPLFVWHELRRQRRDNAVLVDLTMFRLPMFTWGNLTALLVAMGEFALIFVLPLYLVSVVGLSTIATGLVLCAMALGAFFSGAAARHLAARITPPGVVILGLFLEVFGTLQLAAEERVGQPVWLIVVALVLYGLGLGLASAQLTSLVLGDIPVEQSGQGSATQSTIRQIGSALGAAMAGAVLSVALAVRLPQLPPQSAPLGDALRESAGGVLVGLRSQGAPDAVISPLVHVFTMATQLTLYASVICLALGLATSLALGRSALRRAETADGTAPTKAASNPAESAS